jgi:hypothetical protein
MPDGETSLDFPVDEGGEGETDMATVVDDAIHSISLSGLAAEVAACQARRITRADQLQGDSDRMWTIFMTTPNVLTGVGYRTLQQSAGYPADKGTGTGGG